MPFILQGNPKRFDIDDYLARYPYVYWGGHQYTDELQPGERIFFWRAGKDAGIVAVGHVAEAPKPGTEVAYPAMAADDIWRSQADDPFVLKVGVRVEGAPRLMPHEGMIPRERLKHDPLFRDSALSKTRQGTAFRLSEAQAQLLERLWRDPAADAPEAPDPATEEGRLILRRAHYTRERSAKLAEQKRAQLREAGELHCAACGAAPGNPYPEELGDRFLEAHHITPLSQLGHARPTTLDDLILLCANCHRLVHRDGDVEENLRGLVGLLNAVPAWQWREHHDH